MRKQNPNDVVALFRGEITTILADWSALRTALGTTAGPLAKRGTTDAFTRIAVAFEGFRSDWHIAAINRDSQALQGKLLGYAQGQLKAGAYPELEQRVRVDLPTHPPLDLIRKLLDPIDRNLSISGFNHWKKRANGELVDPWKSKVHSIHNHDRAVMHATIAIRNVLAHQSVSASTAMNTALVNFGAPDGALRRGPRKIQPSGLGAYLNAQTAGGNARVEIYAARLDDLAAALIV